MTKNLVTITFKGAGEIKGSVRHLPAMLADLVLMSCTTYNLSAQSGMFSEHRARSKNRAPLVVPKNRNKKEGRFLKER